MLQTLDHREYLKRLVFIIESELLILSLNLIYGSKRMHDYLSLSFPHFLSFSLFQHHSFALPSTNVYEYFLSLDTKDTLVSKDRTVCKEPIFIAFHCCLQRCM